MTPNLSVNTDAHGRRFAPLVLAGWQLAELMMRGPAGFNPHRRAPERRVPRLRYLVIEAS